MEDSDSDSDYEDRSLGEPKSTLDTDISSSVKKPLQLKKLPTNLGPKKRKASIAATLFQRALMVHFERRHQIATTTRMMSNNPDFKGNTAGRWKKDSVVQDYLSNLYAKFGEFDIFREEGVPYCVGNILIKYETIPQEIISKYCGPDTRSRVIYKDDRRLKKNRGTPIDPKEKLHPQSMVMHALKSSDMKGICLCS